MINIKRFIDRVSSIENKQGKDVVIPITEARGLRDELAKLLADKASEVKPAEPVIQIDMRGGTFK